MKLTCEKSELTKAVSIVGRLATTRSTLPILQNIYLEATDNQLLLKSTDLEQTVESIVKADVSESGRLTVPAKLFLDYLQNLPEQSVTLESDDTTLGIKTKNQSSHIRGVAAEEYPNLPEIKTDTTISLPKELLEQLVSKTIFATAFDETRPILTGALFRFKEGQLTVVGTDGYRLARTVTKIDAPLTADYILPKKMLQELQRLLEEGEATLSFSPSQVKVSAGQTTLISRVLEGSYPAFENIIPKTKKLTVSLARAALLQSLKLASLFSRDSAYSTKLEMSGNQLKVTAISPQLGETTNAVLLESEVAEPFSISLNAQYLIDFLSIVHQDVTLSFIDQKSPIICEQKNDQSYLYLLMPLRNE